MERKWKKEKKVTAPNVITDEWEKLLDDNELGQWIKCKESKLFLLLWIYFRCLCSVHIINSLTVSRCTVYANVRMLANMAYVDHLFCHFIPNWIQFNFTTETARVEKKTEWKAMTKKCIHRMLELQLSAIIINCTFISWILYCRFLLLVVKHAAL